MLSDVLQAIATDCEAEGLRIEIQDKNRAAGAVRKAFVKTDSIGSVVTVGLPFERVSSMSSEWLLQALRAKIERVDWKLARDDLRRFLPLGEQRGLDSWTTGLFLHQLDRMVAYLTA